MTKNDQRLLAAFLSLLAFPLLFLLRGFDDNTLTSWRWILNGGNVLPVFGWVLAGTAAALLFACRSAPRTRPGLFLFLFGFLAIVPLWSEPEVVLDAGRYFLQAKHLELHGAGSFLTEWGRSVPAWTDLPLVPLLYGLLFRLAGETRLVLQVFTTLLFSCTLVLTFSTGKRLGDEETGYHAALFLLAIPFLLVQVPLMLVDVPAMFLLALALRLVLAAVDRGGLPLIVLAACSLCLAALAKYSMPLMLPVIALTAVFADGDWKQRLGRAAAVCAAACLLIVPLVAAKADLVRTQLGLLRAYQVPGLSRWHEGLVSTFFFQVHPFVTLLAAAGTVAAFRRKEPRFAVPMLFLAFFCLHVERSRYVLPLFPLLTLGASRGVQLIRHREVRDFIVLSTAAASLAVVLGGYLPFLSRTTYANLQSAGAYLDSLPGESVLVRVLPQRESTGNTGMALPLLDLYTRKHLVYSTGPEARPASGFERSPLRFTWECPLPAFYSPPESGAAAGLAVISSDVLPGNGASREFALDSGTFRYRTVVTVFPGRVLAETVH